MKVALVYDRVNKWGGAERVLLTLHEMFPKAPLYTSVYNLQTAPWAKVFSKVHTSFLQNIPFAKNNHEKLALFMPIAFETFDFSGYDLVISVTSEAAKGIITKPQTRHICYCLTPTRYLWSHYEEYFQNSLLRTISRPVIKYLKMWDKQAAQRPDEVIAISTAVQKRIKQYYTRTPRIVFPPVDLNKFELTKHKAPTRDFYLVVSRLVPYKRVRLVVETFNKLGKKLVVVGTGSEKRKLKELAKPNIRFVKNLTDRQLSYYYFNTAALIMPQEEDFGLVAVEAQAHGTPVVAFAQGGVLDTVEDGVTGILFKDQSIEGITAALTKLEKTNFNTQTIQIHAKKFSKESFKNKLI